MKDYKSTMGIPVETGMDLPKGWTYQRLLNKINTEYQDSKNYTETKRQKKRDQLKLYNNQDKAPERISDNTLYTLMQSWMATTLSDQKATTWLGREWMDEEIASNLNHLARFDWEEMDMPQHEIKRRFHEGMFGVSILQKKEWRNNAPHWAVRDPLSWFPDKKGWLTCKNFRYMYFDVEAPAYTLNEDKGYFNTDIIIESTRSEVTIRNEVAYAEPRLMQTGSQQEVYDGAESVSILEGYTRIDGVPYMVTTANNCTLIIRCEKIEPVTKAEKADPTLVGFPVVLRYYSPIPNDPFGVSLADLSEDQQMSMTILKNLKLLREKDLSLGDTVLISDRVKNRTDLLKAPSLTTRRFVTVEGENMQNLAASIPKAQGSSDYYNFEQQLRSDVQLATGISNVQAGVTEDTKRTASEIQAAQKNANQRFLLNFQIALVADKEFWKLWYRCYQEYMDEKSEKFVRITGGMTPKVTTLKRKDIATIEDPDVVLDSEDNIKRINNEIRDAWMASYNFYMQDPDIPAIAKAIFKRKYYQIVLKIDKEEAYQKIPPSPEEYTAWEDIKLLNRNDPVFPQSMNEDHYTYLIIYQSAEDTKAKWASIEMRKLAIIMQGQQKSIAQEGGAAAQTQAQLVNNMMSKSNQPQSQSTSLTM